MTTLRLGPADHGRPLSYDEFTGADYAGGFQYELIDGRLYVAPAAGLPEDSAREWLAGRLRAYSSEHREVVNHVTTNARVFVPDRMDVTAPEPDVTAYRDFPFHVPLLERRWQDISPGLVAEILHEGDADKDLVRNVVLYRQVPSIAEYWVPDLRRSAGGPLLRAYRRSGRRWRTVQRGPGETYTTRLLPEFALAVDLQGA